MSGTLGWTIGDTARRLGHYAWVEQRLFEVLGRLADLGRLDAQEGSAELALVCLAHAQHHAWHSELWRQRLPLFAGLDAETLVVPPSPGVAQAFDQMVGETGLVGVYRLAIPRMIVVYGNHLAEARPVADGPIIRTLDLVLGDEVRDWREGEALLQSCVLRSGENVRQAASHQASCEAAWVRGQPTWGRGA